jgi:hypothetical protein
MHNIDYELKTLPQYFQDVWDGKKDFELRKNDRDFQVGKTVLLREWDGTSYTGGFLVRRICYVLKDCPQFGLMEGYCILGLEIN